MSQHVILGAKWERLPPEIRRAEDRIHEVCASWEGTPYRSGGSLRGVEADCIGSLFGIIDELDGRQRRRDSDMPHDTSFHNAAAAYRALVRLRRIYAPAVRLRSWCYQPGDLLVVGTSDGGPGHLMMVGARKNNIWHATAASGFTQAGWSLGTGFERLFAAYRLGDRERWVR